MSFRRAFGTGIGGAFEPAVAEADRSAFALRVDALYGVAPLFEERDRIRRIARLHAKLVRQPLMMEPRPVHRILDVHAEIDRIDDYLQDRVDDSGSPGRAEREEWLPILKHYGRRHGREGRLLG